MAKPTKNKNISLHIEESTPAPCTLIPSPSEPVLSIESGRVVHVLWGRRATRHLVRGGLWGNISREARKICVILKQ